MMDRLKILQGDNRETLKTLPTGCARCCVTSPPYFGLRTYLPKGHEDAALEIGQEQTPDAYVSALVGVFREVRRVLTDDGTLWLNLGDSYAHDRIGGGRGYTGLKSKDLIGIPWMVAFALRAGGWYLRSDIIWHKPNPMPESVRDRPTRSHEYIFLLSKSSKYFYDSAAIRERPSPALVKQVEDGYSGSAIKDYLNSSVQDASAVKSRIIDGHRKRIDKQRGHGRRHAGFNDKWDALTPSEQALLGANKRDVWTVAAASFKESHFATFPPELIIPCILAGSAAGDTVLDPFLGSGSTALVALERGRNVIGCDLNSEYVEMANRRTRITPGLAL